MNIRIILFIFTALISTYSYSEININYGQVFPIKEESALEAIQQQSNKVDWQALGKAFKIQNSQASLQKARSNNIRYKKPITKLPFTIFDKYGKVLYEKGFQYNPLLYLTLPTRIIIISSNEDIDILLKNNEKINTLDVLLIANNNINKIKIDKKKYILTRTAANRLGVLNTPAIITQEGEFLKIKEFGYEE